MNNRVDKIKIVHLITKLEMGGAQLNTVFTVGNIDKKKFDVFLISGPGGILTEKVRKDSDGEYSFQIAESLVREINPLEDFKVFREIKKMLKEISPDIVHTHSSKAGIIGRLASRFSVRSAKRIHSVHGFPFSKNQFFLKRVVYILIEKIVSIITDHYIFVSEEDVKTAEKKHFLKKIRKNFSVIRSGFDISRFLNTGSNIDSIREKYRIPANVNVVGVIAPFKPQKGLSHLIEIAALVVKEIKNILFFIAGDGDQRDEIEKKIREKGLENHFRLPGFINEIEKVIPLFDIGVSTALWEGLPQSLVQLRLSKKPVIVSDISGNREIIFNGKNGFLEDPFDHEKFAARIIEVLKDKKLRERFALFEEDLSEWDGDTMVQRQEDLYFQLVNGG